jgi:flagellar biogenesis protein FliO
MTTVIQVAALLIVFPLLWLVRKKKHWFLRWSSFTTKRSRSLEIVDQIRFTPQHSIYLVRLDDRTMTVAVDPSGCHLLGRRRRARKGVNPLRAIGQGA